MQAQPNGEREVKRASEGGSVRGLKVKRGALDTLDCLGPINALGAMRSTLSHAGTAHIPAAIAAMPRSSTKATVESGTFRMLPMQAQ